MENVVGVLVGEVRKKVFVCSPLAEYKDGKLICSVRHNCEQAKRYCVFVCSQGFLPIAPHVYFTQFLNEGVQEERIAGLRMGRQLLKECDEVWIFGMYVSKGMEGDLKVALHFGVPMSNKTSEYLRWENEHGNTFKHHK